MTDEKQRVIDEKAELDGRIARLEDRVCEEPDGLQLDLMRRQLWAMRAYQSTLKQRLEAWQ